MSVLLDWWLEPISGGISWTVLDQYGFDVYRNGERIATLPLSQLQASYIATYRSRHRDRGEFQNFHGYYDYFTEYEDYEVSDKEQYSYYVVLWKDGKKKDEVARSETKSIVAGDFCWGIVVRDDEAKNYQDRSLFAQIDSILELKKSGLRFCKFWMHGYRIEQKWPLGELPDIDIDWKNPDDDLTRLEQRLDELVDEYAFPRDDNNLSWQYYDYFIQALNSEGVSPVPWIGHCPTMPESWKQRLQSDVDSALTRLYIHTRAAARLYRYGWFKVPMWNLENELNWVAMHIAAGWGRGWEWLDETFVENVLRVLSFAVKHENRRDDENRRDEKNPQHAAFYARRTMNFNIHVDQTLFPLGWLAINLAFPFWPNHYPWLFRSLGQHILAWRDYFDVIGLGGYPNYLFAEPILDSVWLVALAEAIVASGTKPVMVTETGYPNGGAPKLVPLLEPCGGWNATRQSKYVKRSTSYVYHGGGSGFFYFTLYNADPTQAPEAIPQSLDLLEWLRSHFTAVEAYWGLLSYIGDDNAFLTYGSILKEGPSPLLSELLLSLWEAGASLASWDNNLLSTGLRVFIPADSGLPVQGAVLIGHEGGSATMYGTSDAEFTKQTGAEPIKYGDVKIFGSEETQGSVTVTYSIGIDEFGTGRDPSKARLYVCPDSWIEAANGLVEIIGDTLNVAGDIAVSLLGGTPICIGYINLLPELVVTAPSVGDTITGESCTIQWSATDPDNPEESLQIDLYCSTDVARWLVIALDVTNTGVYDWSTAGLHSGHYWLKVVAKDPEGATAEATTGPFNIVTLAGSVTVAPNPVTGAGTAFFYTLPEGNSMAKLMIFSIAGRPLFETPLDVNSRRFPSTGTWNPIDQDGVPLANGPYVYVLIADGRVIGQGKMVIQR